MSPICVFKIPFRFENSANSLDEKWGPLSLTKRSGIPKLQLETSKYVLANRFSIVVSLVTFGITSLL